MGSSEATRGARTALPWVGALAAVFASLFVPAAGAQTVAAPAVLAPCGHDLTCATVTVPLDPTGLMSGTVKLYVERYDATGEGATGEGATGEGATGEGATGEGATGEGATGEGATGEGATGEGATGEGATGEGATGEGATGEGATGEGATGEGATGEGATGEGATGESQPGTVLALAGGPGQSAVGLMPLFVSTLGPVLHDNALVAFDPRGVGRSSPLLCPLQDSAAACGAQLGPAAALYATTDSVADIEAVRAALGISQLSLYGVSYGTFTALAYARAYPSRVQRMVLDSVLPSDGDPPVSQSTLRAIKQLFGARCELRCPGLSPLGDLARAIGPRPYGPTARMISELAYIALYQSDLSSLLRSEIPAALYLLAHGDRSALAHVYWIALGIADESADRGPGPAPRAAAPASAGGPAPAASARGAGAAGTTASIASAGAGGAGGAGGPASTASAAGLANAVELATECDDDRFPWQESDGPRARAAAAHAAFAALPGSLLAPFPRQTVWSDSYYSLCLGWPYAGDAPPRVSAPLPAVPALVLSGQDDVRTPPAGARALAAQLPDATLLSVPDSGHAVLANDPSNCSADALAAFFAGAKIVPCGAAKAELLDPLPPRSLSALAPAAPLRGRPGRVLRAAVLTLHHDVGLGVQYIVSAGSGTGTLGGTIHVSHGAHGSYVIRLHGVSYVAGVTVSGSLHSSSTPSYPGTVAVSLRRRRYGSLVLHGDGVITGSLGGHAFTLALGQRLRIIRQGGLSGLSVY